MDGPDTIREYGEPIDPQSIIDPHDPETLELEAGHPGLGDAAYVQRRQELFARCRQHRLDRLGPPLIDYTAEETRIWREVTPKLDELHGTHACAIYLEAKKTLGSPPGYLQQAVRDLLRQVDPNAISASPNALTSEQLQQLQEQMGAPGGDGKGMSSEKLQELLKQMAKGGAKAPVAPAPPASAP